MTDPKDLEKAIAAQKSYVGASIITFLLYCVLYFPGLIFNLMYINDANKTAKITGQKPSGYGCLVILFVLGLIPLVGTVLLIMMMMGIFAIGSIAGS